MDILRAIAWRFMLRGTEKGRFSPMTLFAWLAIGVGVGTMCSLLSVMYGLESSLRDSVLKAYPHVMVRPTGGAQPIAKHEPWTKTLKGLPGVKRVVPYVEMEMIVQSDARTLGSVVWGIPSSEMEAMKDGLQSGALPTLKSKIPQVLPGMELAHHLDVDVKNEIKIISPLKRGGAMGLVPQSQTFEVAGVYASGHYDFDKQYLFMLIEDAQDLAGMGDTISGWHIWGESADSAADLQKKVAAVLPPGLEAQSWQVFNAALFHSLKLEQYSMFLILSFAVLIAVMNIAITLMMHVIHKKRNIGILRALGASSEQVRKIFLWQGTFLGLVGLLLGAILSIVILTYVQNAYEFPDIYYVRTVPVEVRPLSLLLVYGVAVALIIVAAVYPAWRASRVHPIEAIRE